MSPFDTENIYSFTHLTNLLCSWHNTKWWDAMLNGERTKKDIGLASHPFWQLESREKAKIN